MATKFEVGGRIPDTMVPQAGGGPDVPLRGRPREGVVLLFPRPGREWNSYVDAVARETGSFADWDGRAIAVATDPDPELARAAEHASGAFWVVHDPEGVLAPAGDDAAPDPRPPLAVIADRYGEIYHVWEGDAAGPFPEPREIEEWLRFLALQCPE